MNIYDEIKRVENLDYKEVDLREQEQAENNFCDSINECFEKSQLQDQLSITNEEMIRLCRPYDYENGIEEEFYYMKEQAIDEFRENLENLIDIFEGIFENENVINIVNDFYFDKENIDDEIIELIEFNGKKNEIFDILREMSSLFLF